MTVEKNQNITVSSDTSCYKSFVSETDYFVLEVRFSSAGNIYISLYDRRINEHHKVLIPKLFCDIFLKQLSTFSEFIENETHSS